MKFLGDLESITISQPYLTCWENNRKEGTMYIPLSFLREGQHINVKNNFHRTLMGSLGRISWYSVHCPGFQKGPADPQLLLNCFSLSSKREWPSFWLPLVFCHLSFLYATSSLRSTLWTEDELFYSPTACSSSSTDDLSGTVWGRTIRIVMRWWNVIERNLKMSKGGPILSS